MSTILFYISICLVVFCHHGCEACSCTEDHPQDLFCASQYAIQINVESTRDVIVEQDGSIEELVIPDGQSIYDLMDPYKTINTEYEVKVKKVFKGEIKEGFATKIHTPAFSFLCGGNLEIDHTYILMGSSTNEVLQFNLCNYVLDVTDTSAEELQQITNNFQSSFSNGCSGHCTMCHISSCYTQETITNGCKFPKNVDFLDLLESSKYSCVPNDEEATLCQLKYQSQEGAVVVEQDSAKDEYYRLKVDYLQNGTFDSYYGWDTDEYLTYAD